MIAIRHQSQLLTFREHNQEANTIIQNGSRALAKYFELTYVLLTHLG